jgi:glycosyltransferase involved in cell wall biosynthesis
VFKLSDSWTIAVRDLFEKTFYSESTENINLNEEKPTSSVSSNFRLLIITQFYPPDYAATGQLIQELATQLRRQNIEVNVFTGQPGYAFQQQKASASETIDGVSIRRSRSSQLWSNRIRGKAINGILFCLRAGLHLLKSARKNDVLLLTTAPPFLSIAGYVANLLFGTPYVCLVYDLYPDAAIELGLLTPNHLITKLWDKINSLVWNRSQSLIVLNDTMKTRITDRHSQLADKISVIHNWADADWIKPITKQENWFARQHGIDKKFTVLYSGNLGRCHDVETILGAIELLKDEAIQFVFIGAGAKQQSCRQTISERGLNNCLFLPYQDKENLPYSLTACDLALVSIAPGLEGVVAPSKLYGIMAAGVAIAAICQPHSYLRDLFDRANCGVCFDNNDSQSLATFISSAATNSTQIESMGKAARRYMKRNFTPEIIAREYSLVLAPERETSIIPIESKFIVSK